MTTYLLMALGAATLFGLICRLGQLDWRLHKWGPIVLHAVGAVAVLLALKALLDAQSPVAAVVLVIGAGWLLFSWPAWRRGVPRVLWRHPQPESTH